MKLVPENDEDKEVLEAFKTIRGYKLLLMATLHSFVAAYNDDTLDEYVRFLICVSEGKLKKEGVDWDV